MRWTLILAVASLVGGCKFPELPPLDDDAGSDAATESCVDTGADAPDPRCPPERPICVDGICGGRCDTDSDCSIRSDGHNVCLVGDGACVACDEDDRQAAPGTNEDECQTAEAPVCDGDNHVCRACASHDECFSGICDGGRCADPTNVIYLNTAGSNTGECLTREQGCLTLQYALTKLTPTRRYILFVPSVATYTTAPDTTDARFYLVDAHVVGYGATLARYNLAHAIEIENSTVTIEGLRVSSAGSNGIDCRGGTLVLKDVLVENASNYGVSANCDFTMVNSVITNNRGAGIVVDGPVIFRIANNWIIDNGSASSIYGGGRILTSSSQAYFEFNTVAFNRNIPNNGIGDALHCAAPIGSTLFRNNIIIGTAGTPHLTSNGVDNCRHEYTLVSPDNGVTGTGNMTIADPLSFAFFDVGTDDYHLQSGSIAVGMGSAILHAESMSDIDGDPRSGASIEVGADELP